MNSRLALRFFFCPGCAWTWREHGITVIYLHPQFCRFHREQLDRLIEDPNAAGVCVGYWLRQWQADLAKRYPQAS